MKRTLLIILSILFLSGSLSGCASNRISITDKYCNYKCYDYHLACLNESYPFAYEERYYNDDFADYKYKIVFRKPLNTSDEQFICAHVKWIVMLEPGWKNVIMQNPDNYIDVLNDWTIKQIIIYGDELMTLKHQTDLEVELIENDFVQFDTIYQVFMIWILFKVNGKIVQITMFILNLLKTYYYH